MAKMTPDHWHRIEQIYHAALERAQGERAAFLAETCAGDDVLRREVEALLAANDRAGNFLSADAVELEAGETAAEQRCLSAGQQISHYRIVSQIGVGGMGEVYLARDSRLDRQVALKVLPLQFTRDAERLHRFVREAKAASSLNHPNIITIHEIGEATTEAGLTHFIAAEYIEGVTLRQRIAREPMALREALDIAIQMAAALDAAHCAGIIHRDIKPENVMLRPDGLVKVLDFGLAKLTSATEVFSADAETMAREKMEKRTLPGMILGTPRYMSPEQARGHAVDARTDVFSLGAVLHEMLAGQPLFAGQTAADIIAAIIYREAPPLAQSAPDVPRELERIVHQSLAKDAGQRYQTVHDLRIDLQSLKQEIEFQAQLARSGQPASRPFPSGNSFDSARTQLLISPAAAFRRWGVVAAGLLAVALIAGALWKWIPRASPPPRNPRFETLYGRKGQESIYLLQQSRFSPDGKMIAFAAPGDGDNLYVRQISGERETQITFGKWQDGCPIWSPDGERIAFVSNRGNQIGIWALPSLGGTPALVKKLADGETIATGGRQRLVAWAKNEPAIYYEWNEHLFRLDLDSKETARVAQLNQTIGRTKEYSLSHDEREVAFIAEQGEQSDVWRVGLRGGTPRRLTNDAAFDYSPVWRRDGKLFYNSRRESRLQLYLADPSGGEPALIPTGDHQCRLKDSSAAGNRLLCYEQRDESDIFSVSVTPGDPSEEMQVSSDLGAEFWPSVSPDGASLLYQAIRGERFVWDPRRSLLFMKPLAARAQPARLAADAFESQWSPDGEQIGFLRLAGETTHLWTLNSTGGEEKQLVTDNVRQNGYGYNPPFNRLWLAVWSWSPDSRRIAYRAIQGGIANIRTVNADGSRAAQITSSTDAAARFHSPVWSPDGSRLAFVSEVDSASGSRKPTSSVWVTNAETPAMTFQSEAALRLLGWSANNQLIVALADELTMLPTTVNLLRITPAAADASGAIAGAQNQLGSLSDTYWVNLCLAPNGRGVAFVRTLNGRNDIWLASIDNHKMSQPRKITGNSDPSSFFSSLAWSPDGKTIFYDKQTRWNLLTLIDNLD